MISCFRCSCKLDGSIFDLSTLKYTTNTHLRSNGGVLTRYSFICEKDNKLFHSSAGKYLRARFDTGQHIRNCNITSETTVLEEYLLTCDGCQQKFCLSKEQRAYKTRTFEGSEYHFCSAICGLKAETKIKYKKKHLIYIHKDFESSTNPQFFADYYNCVECNTLIRVWSGQYNFCRIESIKYKDTFVLLPACDKCMPIVKLCPDVEE